MLSSGKADPVGIIFVGSPVTWKAIRNYVSGSPGSQEMTQPQWHAHQYNNWLYGKTKQAKQKPKAHILNICPFLWCNYSHCGWFQVTSGLTTGLQKSWKFTNWLLWAVISWVKHTAATGSHFCPGHSWSKASLCKSCQELQQHGWYQLCRDHRKAVADPCPSAKGTRTSQKPCTDPCQPWTQGKVEDESWEDGCYWPAKPTASGRPHQAKGCAYCSALTVLRLPLELTVRCSLSWLAHPGGGAQVSLYMNLTWVW